MTLVQVHTAVARWSYSVVDEDDLQAALGLALEHENIAFEREVVLGPRDRIDLLAGDVGIEVKVDGSRASVLRQLQRYAKHERIGALLLVSPRARHLAMPETLGGKPLAVFQPRSL